MSDAEIRLLEQTIEQLKRTELEMTSMKTELEMRLEELANVKQTLIRLLPPEKRIDRLFY